MDLELSDDQFELRDNIRLVLEGASPLSYVRGIYEGTEDASTLWTQTSELYWPALGVAEDAGGLGLGFVEIGLLAEELGRAAAPGPLLAVVSQYLPLSITGKKAAVLGGACADVALVVARIENEGLAVFLVERSEIDVRAEEQIDPGLDLADLVFDAASAQLLLAPGATTDAALVDVTQRAAVAMALHTVGACRRIFEVTLEYLKVRVQYDRVIGSFQAIKHRFADLFLAVERANAVGYYAALAIEEDDPARIEAVHIAKVAASDCQRLLAEDGLQLHGGIGYTWENDLHFLLKRAKAADALCGSRVHHRAELAQQLGLLEVVG
jgi:alkylation response protein AidB-like acyl-CoA dehydrogenase